MFGVLFHTNYDNETEVIVCRTYEEAENVIEMEWQDFYNTELAESLIPLVEEECYHEDDFAKLEYANGDQVYWEIIPCRAA